MKILLDECVPDASAIKQSPMHKRTSSRLEWDQKRRLAATSIPHIVYENDLNLLECGGKRSATPLWIASALFQPKRRRRCAPSAHSKNRLAIESPPTPAPTESISLSHTPHRL